MENDLQIPPNSPEAEQAVLAALILDNSKLSEVSDSLDVSDFYQQRHRLIYKAMIELFVKGQPVDYVTTIDQLKRQQCLEEIGGVVYLTELETPSAANVMHYVEVVKDRGRLRSVLASARNIADACLRAGANADEVTDQLQQLALSSGEGRRGRSTLRRLGDILREALDHFQSPRLKGIRTGYTDLDRIVPGLVPGDLVVIAGRTSMGKSAMAADIVDHAATVCPVGVFSLEMSEKDVVARLISKRSRVNLRDIRNGQAFRDSRCATVLGAAADMEEWPVFIDQNPRTTAAQMKHRMREAEIRYGVTFGLAVVDYLQLMQSEQRHDSDNARVSEISRSLKLLAKELMIPVIALSQLSRAVESRPFRGHQRRPKLSDLRDSGAIEQDADIVIGLYRPEVYEPDDEQLRGLADALVLKQRNGPTGIVPLTWLPAICTFKDAVPPEQQEEYNRGPS